MLVGGPPLFALIFYARAPFIYETAYGGADRAPAGRSALRFSTLAQAHALGKKLEKASADVAYSIFKIDDGDMVLKGSYPKRVNAEGATIRFRRRRRPPTGGADDTRLGVGGMCAAARGAPTQWTHRASHHASDGLSALHCGPT